jgi:hypothetical protein
VPRGDKRIVPISAGVAGILAQDVMTAYGKVSLRNRKNRVLSRCHRRVLPNFRRGGTTRQNRLGARLWWGGRAPSHFTAVDFSLFAFAPASARAFCLYAPQKGPCGKVQTGENHRFTCAASRLWASAGGVVSPCAWGHLFSTAKARFTRTRSQKSRHTAANFGLSN